MRAIEVDLHLYAALARAALGHSVFRRLFSNMCACVGQKEKETVPDLPYVRIFTSLPPGPFFLPCSFSVDLSRRL